MVEPTETLVETTGMVGFDQQKRVFHMVFLPSAVRRRSPCGAEWKNGGVDAEAQRFQGGELHFSQVNDTVQQL